MTSHHHDDDDDVVVLDTEDEGMTDHDDLPMTITELSHRMSRHRIGLPTTTISSRGQTSTSLAQRLNAARRQQRHGRSSIRGEGSDNIGGGDDESAEGMTDLHALLHSMLTQDGRQSRDGLTSPSSISSGGSSLSLSLSSSASSMTTEVDRIHDRWSRRRAMVMEIIRKARRGGGGGGAAIAGGTELCVDPNRTTMAVHRPGAYSNRPCVRKAVRMRKRVV